MPPSIGQIPDQALAGRPLLLRYRWHFNGLGWPAGLARGHRFILLPNIRVARLTSACLIQSSSTSSMPMTMMPRSVQAWLRRAANSSGDMGETAACGPSELRGLRGPIPRRRRWITGALLALPLVGRRDRGDAQGAVEGKSMTVRE